MKKITELSDNELSALRENGFEQVGWFAVVASVQTHGIPRYEYRDRRYRYSSMRRALQTLSNFRRLKFGGPGWHWKVVHYYPGLSVNFQEKKHGKNRR